MPRTPQYKTQNLSPVWYQPLISVSSPRVSFLFFSFSNRSRNILTRVAPSDELTGRHLARRGHSSSAWQSCRDTQTWLTATSCLYLAKEGEKIITTTDDVEDERYIWSEGWILGGYVDSSASPRWQPFTQTAEELSGTFVRAPGAEETEHPRESQSPGFGLVRRDSERVFFFRSPLDRSSLFPLQLFYYFSFFTSSSYQHKFCDIILATFRSVRMRRLKWITWMWLRDRLLPLRHSHSFFGCSLEKDSPILIRTNGQKEFRFEKPTNNSKHRDLEFCRYTTFALLFFFIDPFSLSLCCAFTMQK